MANKKLGLMIYSKYMVSLSTVFSVSLEDPDSIEIMFSNDRLIRINVDENGEFKILGTDYCSVPVNEFHRIKRELEEYFDVTFN
ncbi:hypothetical protein CTM76_20435 [Photobacterium phosphoreum]|uniref:hypothetical protein n=1 Tax=Photobacterium phosphoreum TaxID=659 RepID=UPI0007F9399F|nr:hypothetical protein [Photobacterium phosphoreum]MCD9469318.1 hypothetical protein [Photobacterium phosphoreum]OBU35124.1 hypothetical protein AYY25_19580 [Photobacterium phosphoreum]PSU58092.1 hypothetical protein CTM80_17340 [Photobacterium phosphoreum]PSU74966.1 hypothetical protein CTM76_20435 [Photobacterium phosphoreum]PSU85500.1 hypothetical protein CTM93_03295 [Photobacterium phosphoreum]